jgi:2'-5' RNA ligase
MYKDPPAWDRVNSFALVSYIPEPLAGFLDSLRQELVPNCFLRAHVTILPPRAISCSPEKAWEAVRTLVPHFAPFEVELSRVEVFPVTDVIYVDLSRGRPELQLMHDGMNRAGLNCTEPYPYHPHVTLAQELKSDEVDELARVARTRWADSKLCKTFRVERAVFVQNTRCNEWIDLGESTLGQGESRLVTELVNLVS